MYRRWRRACAKSLPTSVEDLDEVGQAEAKRVRERHDVSTEVAHIERLFREATAGGTR